MNNPKISIIVPVYNVEKYLRRCLDSIVAQTFTDWECICVDDGSPDNSGKILDEYASKDQRFVIIHKENGGVSSARNAGLDIARGEWIGFVDSDDWIEVDYIETMLDTAERESADIVVCDYWNNFDKKQVDMTVALDTSSKETILKQYMKTQLFMNSVWNKIFKSSFIIEQKLSFPLNISICEDLLFSFEACYKAKKVVKINELLYHYSQINKSSATKNYKTSYIDDKIYVTEKIEKLLENEHLKYQRLIYSFEIYSKLPLLIHKNIRDYKRWLSIYPNSSRYIWNTFLRFDYKVISWLASIHMFELSFFFQDIKSLFKKK